VLTHLHLFFLDLQARWAEPLSIHNHVYAIEAHRRNQEGRTFWDDMCDDWDNIRYYWCKNFGV
jgi:hypothetical protein